MADPGVDTLGWAARLDALEPDVLPTEVDDQLQVWRARVEDLRSRAKANDHPSLTAFEDTLDQVETVIEHAEMALGRLIHAPDDERGDGEAQLARRMEAVEADLHRATQELVAEVRTPST